MARTASPLHPAIEPGVTPPGQDPQARRQEALSAEKRQDWTAALALWSGLRTDRPDDARVYVGEAVSLIRLGRTAEADNCLRDARTRFPGSRDIAERFARLAGQRGDHAEAAERWRATCAAFPQSSAAYTGLAAALTSAGQPEAAERALGEAFMKQPGSLEMLSDFARAAASRCDWKAAAERWSAVRDAFPEHAAGHVGHAFALRAGGHAALALAAIEEAASRFPKDFDVQAERARGLAAIDRIDDALTAWEAIRATFTDRPAGFSEPAALLRRQKRHDACRELLGSGLARFPEWHVLRAERAHLAGAIPDWPDAMLQWQRFLEVRPGDRMGRACYAGAAFQLGRLDEAQDILDGLLGEMPRHLPTLILRARLDMARGAWDAAIARMTYADTIVPGDKAVAAILAEAQETKRQGQRRS